MTHKFHPEAAAEFEQATAWYADREPGLGRRFISAIETAVLTACDTPHRFRRFDGDIRRVLVGMFPYAVLYSVEDKFIHVLAIMHCSREPGYWKDRELLR